MALLETGKLPHFCLAPCVACWIAATVGSPHGWGATGLVALVAWKVASTRKV